MVSRRDLPIGVMVAQVVHAAGESSPGNLAPGTYAVALEVEDESALRELARRLGEHEVPFRRIVESDGPHAGELMAIGLEPGPKSQAGRYLSSIPLIRRDRLSRTPEAGSPSFSGNGGSSPSPGTTTEKHL